MSKSILVDTSRCIGCGSCVAACKEANGLPASDTLIDLHLSADTLNVVQTHGSIFVRRFCMHCQEPTCASVCPVGALHKTAAGPVLYDADKCMGCRYCMMACPFGIPRYEWKVALPKVKKCTMCEPRQAQGKNPACTDACPVQASVFGGRQDLLIEAEKRLAAEPSKYFPRVYGKEEVGGTSVLYLSAVPFEELGLPTNLPRDPMPMLTYRVLSKIPNLVTLGGVLLGGIWWITRRRDEVRNSEETGNREPGTENRK